MAYTGQRDALRKSEWEVRPCELSTAQSLVERFHYSGGGSNTRIATHGLFPKGSFWEADCMGVAWWLPPTRVAAEYIAGDDWQGVAALTRLVVHPDCPANAATFLMARSIKLLDRKKWPFLVSFADSWRGHTGAIYRASGWVHEGTTNPSPVYVRNGRLVARKAGPTSRTHEEMLALGAELIGHFPKERYVIRRALDDRPA